MKKSLLALAALTAFAGAASAQSSVTLGGRLDLGVGKAIGNKDKAVLDSSGSRLNFNGREDLGGGLFAVFGMEHRISPDTGESTNARFWNGYSFVGLQGGFGNIRLGRDYTSAFAVQNAIDPFGGDTVAALRQTALTPGVAKLRTANQIKYFNTIGGFGFGADIGEGSPGNKRPYSVQASYGAGPVYLGIAYENPTDADDNWLVIGGRFTMGSLTLRAGVGNGRTETDAKIRGWLLGANWRMGAGDLKFGYATQRVASVDTAKKFGVGYHYDLSKRTKLYADFGRDSKAAVSKTGYDFGIYHNF